MPTPIVCGSGDAPPIVRSARRTAAIIAGRHLQTYEGAPHGLFPIDAAHYRP